MSEKLTAADLAQFTGTAEYHPHWTGRLVYTDGVQYLADKGRAHWLLDAIAAYQADRRITGSRMLRDIQFWRLTVTDGRAALTCVADSGRAPVITQDIEYTDFPLAEVEIWVERGSLPAANDQGYVEVMVAMLPGER